jgi:hypothetical protein
MKTCKPRLSRAPTLLFMQGDFMVSVKLLAVALTSPSLLMRKVPCNAVSLVAPSRGSLISLAFPHLIQVELHFMLRSPLPAMLNTSPLRQYLYFPQLLQLLQPTQQPSILHLIFRFILAKPQHSIDPSNSNSDLPLTGQPPPCLPQRVPAMLTKFDSPSCSSRLSCAR